MDVERWTRAADTHSSAHLWFHFQRNDHFHRLCSAPNFAQLYFAQTTDAHKLGTFRGLSVRSGFGMILQHHSRNSAQDPSL